MAIDPKWRKLPMLLVALGGLIGVIGLFANSKQFAFSYLTAFMFFLSLCLGGLFLTLIHHLFDAQWSVPLRRVNEHLAFLLPVMAALFVPIAIMAPQIYDWMRLDPQVDHALHAKQPLFTKGGFYGVAIGLFVIWTWLSLRLRSWSILQDSAVKGQSVAGKVVFPEQLFIWVGKLMGNPAENDLPVFCSRMMRIHAGYGILVFALTLTLGAIMWVKGIEHQWFSTMYGVYYFAGSVWTTLGTVYVITVLLQRTGPLAAVVKPKTFHDTGVLWFAFTVFYAYIHFSQYFLIWNAAMPEETFWYVKRENGSWWDIGLITVFGHFLLPFLAMLRIDAKLKLPLMIPLAAWAWLCHYCDMQYNIMPKLHPEGVGYQWLWVDLACMAFIGGVLLLVWLKYFKAHAPYPVKDPRLGEALDVHFYEEPGAAVAGKAHH